VEYSAGEDHVSVEYSWGKDDIHIEYSGGNVMFPYNTPGKIFYFHRTPEE